MTYIEFFDENVIENICGCLVSIPDCVVLLGGNEKLMDIHAERYHEFFLDRGSDVEFIVKPVNISSLEDIVDLLSDIVEEYEDCVFDLTGGQELMLTAAGIVYHRYRDIDIQLHRFNLRNNTLYDCDGDGRTISVDTLPELSVSELVQLYGGKVVFDYERGGSTASWNWNAEFIDDVDDMWEICRSDVRAWNIHMSALAACDKMTEGGGLLTSVAVPSKFTDLLNSSYTEPKKVEKVFAELARKGLIICSQKLILDGKHNAPIPFRYKNEQVKKCLIKAGLALELKVTLAAILAKDKDDEYIYNDVKNGVYIDWDGDLSTPQRGNNTENEIDVVMMHGMVPVFVSCKNGSLSMDELYKLNTVANKFGGKYSKKVLIATALYDDSPFSHSLAMRAEEMNIRLISTIQKSNSDELEERVGSLWKK